MRRRRPVLVDDLIIWGFLLSLIGILGAGCFELVKIITLVPGAFDSAPGLFRNPMRAADNDYPPSRFFPPRLSDAQRAQYEQMRALQENQ